MKTPCSAGHSFTLTPCFCQPQLPPEPPSGPPPSPPAMRRAAVESPGAGGDTASQYSSEDHLVEDLFSEVGLGEERATFSETGRATFSETGKEKEAGTPKEKEAPVRAPPLPPAAAAVARVASPPPRQERRTPEMTDVEERVFRTIPRELRDRASPALVFRTIRAWAEISDLGKRAAKTSAALEATLSWRQRLGQGGTRGLQLYFNLIFWRSNVSEKASIF